MLRKFLLIITLFFLLPGLLTAQVGKLRGLVTGKETGEPIQGVNIFIERTDFSASASTDLNGAYVVLGVVSGVYTVRAERDGYQSVVISNVRIRTNLTTNQDFSLPAMILDEEVYEVVAERPLIQRNTTSTIRLAIQEDIQYLPVRGLQNLISLEAGTVLQDGHLHVRGGRAGEIAYFIDGVTAINPLTNEENFSAIQEAVEEIQMLPGGYTAEYGGANSGAVRTAMKTGGARYKATIDYRTDDFAKTGEQFLGTSSFGYRNAVVTLSGPVYRFPKLRFFLAGQHNYMRQRNPSFIEPFNTDDFIDPVTGQTLGELGGLVDDGYEGREIGEPLPEGGVIKYDRNSLPGSWRQENTGQGTILINATENLKFRFTGSYSHLKYPTEGSDFYSNLRNVYYNPGRIPIRTTEKIFGSLRATHIINPSTFYEASVFYSNSSSETVDPEFGSDWKKYTDREANAELGYTGWRSKYWGPNWISTIYNFDMEPPGYPVTDYSKNSEMNIGGFLDFTTQLNRNWELKAGGRVDTWVMRCYEVERIQIFMDTEMGWQGDDPHIWESDYERWVELASVGWYEDRPIIYGYDIDGNKLNTFPNGPRKPLFASFYVQNKFEYRDLIINLGLRFERIDIKAPKPKDNEDPAFDQRLDWIDEDKMVETDPYHYLLPRLGLSFPVTKKTVFYTSYGKYVQMPALNQVYRGIPKISKTVSPFTSSIYGYFGQWAGYTAKPEHTTQYEMGIRQSLSDNLALTLTAYYKKLQDRLRYGLVYSDGTGDIPEEEVLFSGLQNEDVGTAKGVEFTLQLRRTRRIAARVNYTWSDTRGTGSDVESSKVYVSDEWDIYGWYPPYVFPLDYHQPHRGSVILDYRFGKGDGGKIFEGSGINLLFTFNSGHSYTKFQEVRSIGCSTLWNVGVRTLRDPRSQVPEERLNSSLTPWNSNVDLSVNKVFFLGRLNVDLYIHVLNLFDTKHVINVYPMTRNAKDDGWLYNIYNYGYTTWFRDVPQYVEFYKAINNKNRWAYQQATGKDLYGTPRQIRVGVRLEFN